MSDQAVITLDDELQRRINAKAAALGISPAEYVRLTLERDLGPERREPYDITRIFDLGESIEPTDIARDKDKMLGEAVWEEHQRKTAPRKRRRKS